MAVFGVNDVDNYGSNGSAGFFSLKDDKDSAVARFMYETVDDIELMAVHEVNVDGKKRYVDCLRTYNEPVDNCPFCAAKMRVYAKIFIPMYDEDTGEVKVWDRGKTFVSKLSSLASRYQPLVSTLFEIERNGKRGDKNTTYETYPLNTDEVTLADLPELPVILGGLVLDKSFDEMNFYLDNGFFEDLDPADTDDSIDEDLPFNGGTDPNRRNPANDRRPVGGSTQARRSQRTQQTQRRTPLNTNGNQSAPAGRRTPQQQNSRDRF